MYRCICLILLLFVSAVSAHYSVSNQSAVCEPTELPPLVITAVPWSIAEEQLHLNRQSDEVNQRVAAWLMRVELVSTQTYNTLAEFDTYKQSVLHEGERIQEDSFQLVRRKLLLDHRKSQASL